MTAAMARRCRVGRPVGGDCAVLVIVFPVGGVSVAVVEVVDVVSVYDGGVSTPRPVRVPMRLTAGVVLDRSRVHGERDLGTSAPLHQETQRRGQREAGQRDQD